MRLYTREQIRAIDQTFLKQGGDLSHLIDRVGYELGLALHRRLPPGQRILILAGPGHNGDDGLAMAKTLKQSGHQIEILLASGREPRSYHHLLWTHEQQNWPVKDPHVIVDAIFGIGLDRPLRPEVEDLLGKANQTAALRVALDVPTGVDANTGALWSEAAFHADLTLTVAEYKVGCFLAPARTLCGEVVRVPIDSLQHAAWRLPLPGPDYQELSPPQESLAQLRPSPSSHKYNRGVANIVQSLDFPGAALMAARAAQCAGVGYVRLWCPKKLTTAQALQEPGIVMQPYETLHQLEESMKETQHASAWLIGSGWAELPQELANLMALPHSLVLDGGCLQAQLLKWLPSRKDLQTVLTPHQGELNRLTASQDKSTLTQVDKICLNTPATLVKKGFETLISQKNQATAITTWNSPNLAFAGSGDILAGLITGLLAQGLGAYEASLWAVYLHREAASRQELNLNPEGLLVALSKTVARYLQR